VAEIMKEAGLTHGGFYAHFDSREGMLAEAAAAAGEVDVRLVPFWPLRGAAYDRELLVIGRSVNGWVDDFAKRRRRSNLEDVADGRSGGPGGRRILRGERRAWYGS